MTLAGNKYWGGDAEYPEPVAASAPQEQLTESAIGPGLLRNWLEAIAVVHDEAPFVFDDDGITAKVVSDAKTAILDTTLYREGFEQYRHDHDAPVERILEIRPLWETAGIADPGDDETVSITVAEEGRPLYLQSGPVGRTVATYDELNVPRYQNPGHDWQYRGAFDRRDLAAAAQYARVPFKSDAGSGQDGIYDVFADPDGTLRMVGSSDIDDVDAPVPTVDVIDAPEQRIHSRYPGEWIRDVVGTIPDGATVAFQFYHGGPFRLRWTLKHEVHGEQQPVAEATFIVAPCPLDGA